MKYEREQIIKALQLLNELRVSGIDNCSRITEISMILQNPSVDITSEDNSDDVDMSIEE